jgi:hypothetical protein
LAAIGRDIVTGSDVVPEVISPWQKGRSGASSQLFLLDIMLNVLFFGRSSDLNWRSGGCWRETSAADLELATRPAGLITLAKRL